MSVQPPQSRPLSSVSASPSKHSPEIRGLTMTVDTLAGPVPFKATQKSSDTFVVSTRIGGKDGDLSISKGPDGYTLADPAQGFNVTGDLQAMRSTLEFFARLFGMQEALTKEIDVMDVAGHQTNTKIPAEIEKLTALAESVPALKAFWNKANEEAFGSDTFG